MELGIDSAKLFIVGSVKFDLLKNKNSNNLASLFNITSSKLLVDKKVILGSSTWPGEEILLINIFKRISKLFPNLILVIAPRHAERADDIDKLINSSGYKSWRRTNETYLEDLKNCIFLSFALFSKSSNSIIDLCDYFYSVSFFVLICYSIF